ncbi:MAG: hypothetical protein ABIT58_04125 [Ferruginibacter sp.]
MDYLCMTGSTTGTTKDMYAPLADMPDDQLSKWDFNAWYMAQNKPANAGIFGLD